MEQRSGETRTPRIIQDYRRVGHLSARDRRRGIRTLLRAVAAAILVLTTVRPALAQGMEQSGTTTAASGGGRWWSLFATGFASSILAHEGGHIVAAYAVGGRPSFGLNEGRPTIYSGIDATLEPRKQFVFSSAGLTVQSVIDEGILATSLFYVTIGRTGSVSDVEFMARTSRLNKTSITAIYGGLALVHVWRIRHDSRYTNFFVRPDGRGAMRIGIALDPPSR
jgi:hypothetical protein